MHLRVFPNDRRGLSLGSVRACHHSNWNERQLHIIRTLTWLRQSESKLSGYDRRALLRSGKIERRDKTFV